MKRIKKCELNLVNGGGDCECSSAVVAIGEAVGEVVNYFEELAFAVRHVNWLGVS